MCSIRSLSVSLVAALLLNSCTNEEATKTAAVQHVDSATQSASDTLRASTDTSAHRVDTSIKKGL